MSTIYNVFDISSLAKKTHTNYGGGGECRNLPQKFHLYLIKILNCKSCENCNHQFYLIFQPRWLSGLRH